jgi:hypothetical protein
LEANANDRRIFAFPDVAVLLIDRAVTEHTIILHSVEGDRLENAADLAYRFAAGSYSYAALVGAIHLRDALAGDPNWIAAYEDYAEHVPELAGEIEIAA